jgi:hypothetical protein
METPRTDRDNETRHEEHIPRYNQKELMRARLARRYYKQRQVAATVGKTIPPWIEARRVFSNPFSLGYQYAHFSRTRSEALSHGRTYYLTGTRCANGHYALRYARNGRCLGCAGDRTFPVVHYRAPTAPRPYRRRKPLYDIFG